MPKTIRKRLPLGRIGDDPVEGRQPLGNAARAPTRVIGLRLTDEMIVKIDSNFRYRKLKDPHCPSIYNQADHIRYLISQGLSYFTY